jgi:FMN-dependent oxidoreductase (nitrilotriacetate monooxygenase family)
VRHQGRHYQVDAIHLAEPSPQRTPVLYQAGSSTRGREFAATHAECIFVFGADKRITREIVADIRGRAAANGRDPRDILIFYNRAAVVGRTRREAEEKYREYHKHASVEGALAHFSSSTGLDLSRYAQDEPIRYVKNDAINSAVETLTTMSAEPWTLRRIVGRMGLGSRNPAIVGSAEEVADDLIAWVEETDIDGFNLSRIVTPESLEDFVDLVVPILQERGAYKRDYLPGTLREKLFGRSRLLPPSHPVGPYRPPATCDRKSS